MDVRTRVSDCMEELIKLPNDAKVFNVKFLKKISALWPIERSEDQMQFRYAPGISDFSEVELLPHNSMLKTE